MQKIARRMEPGIFVTFTLIRAAAIETPRSWGNTTASSSRASTSRRGSPSRIVVCQALNQTRHPSEERYNMLARVVDLVLPVQNGWC